MLAQIAAMLLFDVLIDNADRWSGANTMMSPDGKLLYFMDNTLAFSTARFGHAMSVGAMRRAQVFPRGLVQRLRELTQEEIASALAMPASSKLGKLINSAELSAIREVGCWWT